MHWRELGISFVKGLSVLSTQGNGNMGSRRITGLERRRTIEGVD